VPYYVLLPNENAIFTKPVNPRGGVTPPLQFEIIYFLEFTYTIAENQTDSTPDA
jgi:hypothetical protein